MRGRKLDESLEGQLGFEVAVGIRRWCKEFFWEGTEFLGEEKIADTCL